MQHTIRRLCSAHVLTLPFLTGSSPPSDSYWLTELKIHLTETYSQASISPNERLPHYDFRFVLQKRPLFQMMQSTSALVFSPKLLHALHTQPVFFGTVARPSLEFVCVL